MAANCVPAQHSSNILPATCHHANLLAFAKYTGRFAKTCPPSFSLSGSHINTVNQTLLFHSPLEGMDASTFNTCQIQHRITVYLFGFYHLMFLFVWPCYTCFRAWQPSRLNLQHLQFVPLYMCLIACVCFNFVSGHFLCVFNSRRSSLSACVSQVYQSLDHELQRHVSLQDTLKQCQTWLTSVSEEPEPPAHPPLSLEEALQQVRKPLPTPKKSRSLVFCKDIMTDKLLALIPFKCSVAP